MLIVLMFAIAMLCVFCIGRSVLARVGRDFLMSELENVTVTKPRASEG
jgi:hypothetical protein